MTRGPRLSGLDLELLSLVANQRLLTSDQMYLYYSHFKATAITSFRVKLNRWVKYGLIVPMKYSLGQNGFNLNYYRIGTKGVDKLCEVGILPTDWEDKDFKDYDRKNLDHFLATQDVAVRTIVNMKGEGWNVDSIPPFEYLYLDEEDLSNKLVVPDWIIKHQDTFLNIELDIGTESPQQLREKVEGYIRLCTQKPSQNHIVLIAVIDDSFRSRFSYGKDRSRRIGNIKKALFQLPGLHLPNLSVYVLSLSRVPVHIVNLLTRQLPRDETVRRIELDVGIEILSDHNLAFEYEIVSEENVSAFYPAALDTSFYGDKVVYFRNYSGTVSKPYHLFLLEEGNVKQLDRLHSLYESIRYSTSLSRNILAVYTTTDERVNDVLGSEYHNLLIGDVQEWVKDMQTEPKFYYLSSPYRLEGTTFEGKVYT